jgi:hypothetical protein
LKCRAHQHSQARSGALPAAVATVEELDALSADQPMTAEQAATLKRLAEAGISMLTAKLKLLEGPAEARRIAANIAKLPELLGK